MTRAMSVIDDCINKLKLEVSKKINEPKREKRDTLIKVLDKKESYSSHFFACV